jgi:carbamoyl-phosphate synthase large subunit
MMSSPRLTVLFSSAGRRVGLIECFRQAAGQLGVELRVVAVDIAPELSAACAIADRALRVPKCTAPGFATSIAEIVRDEEVHLVIPTIDTELPAYAAARVMLQEGGAWTSVSTPSLVNMARDKLLTARQLERAGVAVPRTRTLEAALAAPRHFAGPVTVKPRTGSASIGVRTVGSLEHLEAEVASLAARGEDVVVQEHLDGPEYTVNLFFDRSGTLRSAVPHRRIEIRAGEVSKARTTCDPRFMNQAERVASALEGAVGSVCYQAIDVASDREPLVIELNARFGGGYPVAHRAGAHFARWLLEEALGREPSVGGLADWRDGTTMLRYDAAVFLSAASVQ